MKKLPAILLSVLFVISLASCAKKPAGTPDGPTEEITTAAPETAAPAGETETAAPGGDDLGPVLTVTKDEKFGAALLSVDQASFEALGFQLGDSCDVVFSNGYTLTDVPYFNGYYVRNGAPVIVAYPGDPNVRVTLNNLGIWEQAGLSDGDGVEITLLRSGKYAAVQEALGQSYSFEREDYPSDEAFCNFRALSGGSLKEDFFFRGASPVDNSRGRAAFTDALLGKTGVAFVIDLADSEEDMEGYLADPDFKSGYTKNLYETGADVLLDMSSSYTSDAYAQKVAEGLRAALVSDGPFYVHCMEGKDRTGFVCALLEALAGATFDEMKRDYMTTYENYFGVTKEETPEKFDAIVDLYFVPFMEFLHGTQDLETLKAADYREDAAAYLQNGGMTGEEIASLRALITE